MLSASSVTAPQPFPAEDLVSASIEAHRAAWAEFSAVAKATAKARFLSKGEARRHAAADVYDTATDALVRTPITTMAGLGAFAGYVASLQAYGARQFPDPYQVQVWHLSDAMEAIAEALARMAPPEALPSPTAH